MKNIIKIVSLIGLSAISQVAYSGSITDTFANGDTLTATHLNNAKAAVNDNDARITTNASDIGDNFSLITTNDTRITAVESRKYLTLNPYSAAVGMFDATVNIGGAISANGIRLPDSVSPIFGLGFTLPPDYLSGDPITIDFIWHTQSVACGIDFRPVAITIARVGQRQRGGGLVGLFPALD